MKLFHLSKHFHRKAESSRNDLKLSVPPCRQMALLEQQLAFRRGLTLETGGLEMSQSISRPWVYSYFTLLQLLGLNPETTAP